MKIFLKIVLDLIRCRFFLDFVINKLFHQSSKFKLMTPFVFCIKMILKLTSELETGERLTMAISGISVKKVTKLIWDLY